MLLTLDGNGDGGRLLVGSGVGGWAVSTDAVAVVTAGEVVGGTADDVAAGGKYETEVGGVAVNGVDAVTRWVVVWSSTLGTPDLSRLDDVKLAEVDVVVDVVVVVAIVDDAGVAAFGTVEGWLVVVAEVGEMDALDPEVADWL